MHDSSRRRAPAAPVVLKFGGFALQFPGAVAARIRRVARDGPVVVVASAREGITDLLEFALRSARPTVGALVARLRALHPGGSDALRAELDQARRCLVPSGPGRATGVARAERVRSIGERLAVRWLAAELDRRGLPSVPLDADRIGLRVAGPSERGRILLVRSRRAVRASLARAWRTGRIPIVTGYFGRAPDGGVRTLGRSGSDYTATALAQIVGARRVELVKPSASLRLARAGLPPAHSSMLRVSYRAAEAIARSGPSLIHPRTVGPARSGRIAIVILPLRASRALGIRIGPAEKKIRSTPSS